MTPLRIARDERDAAIAERDALRAERDEALRKVFAKDQGWAVANQQRDAAIARAEAAEKDLADCQHVWNEAEQEAAQQMEWKHSEQKRADDAEAKLAAARAEAGRYAEAANKLSRVYIAARNLCFGTDWNNGSQAKYQCWRQSLVDAVHEVEPLPDCACRPSAALAPGDAGKA